MMRAITAAAFAAAAFLYADAARADLLQLRWTTEGYYRARTVFLTNLAPQPRQVRRYAPTGEEIVIPDIRRTSYMIHRLRLQPTLSYGNIASLHFQIDALDDVLWGDNNGVSSAPLFATDASGQYFLGGEERESVRLRKAWVQFQVPVGLMRVGRMPSHWGMGLLANGGGSGHLDPDPARPKGWPQRKVADHFFPDDFGDKHFGSVADRILFITKPLSIAKTIRKEKDTSSKLVVGYAFDKLSEAPLFPAEPFERRFRPFGQQGFISRGRDDDVNEHVVLAVWNDPYPEFGGPWSRTSDELRAGVYGVLRTSREGSTFPSDPDLEPGEDTGSKVYILDAWARLRYGPLYGETEMLFIGGKTFGGVPFPSKNQPKKAHITGGVLRLGWFGTDALNQDLFDVTLEVGHASGDDVLEDEKFKQRALHPDYNVGLILFGQTLRELSARTYGLPFFSDENPDGAIGFFSQGGVINANYLYPKARYHLPLGDMTLVGALLMAWVDTPAQTGTAMFYADEVCGSSGNCGFFDAYLGTEVDVALKTRFAGNMDFSLESGVLFFGKALKRALPNASTSFTLQTRLAFLW